MSTWILLRGLTRESRHWGDFLAQFTQAFPASQIVALDLPGNGLLNQQHSPLNVQGMLAQCREQLVLRQLKPPFHVLAMSLGAMVAVAWGQSHPQEVAGLVLINTSMRPFSPFYQRLRPENYGVLLKLGLIGAVPAVWAQTVLRLTSHRAPQDVLAQWQSLQLENPVSRANALRQIVAAARFRALAVKPLAPTLVLASEQDRLVSVACSKNLARHWGCPLRLHPTAGHDLPLDDGAWVVTQVQQWLK